ncbi:MAG: hypothetical protein JSV22_00470 [Bacteroidales bacterium]|nr:MAG: hypothetical protein JSV22_00470 [Bacteroidales bacterium]
MKFKLLFACLLFLMFNNINAQEEDKVEADIRPFQLTFITPLGTNGTLSPRIINKFSLNILAGYNGGVDGLELGGFLNLTDDYVKGFQVAGFGNISGGNTEAAQLAGFMNINGGEVKGLQGSGFINIAGGRAEAVQIGGFTNLSGPMKGIQASGFGNIAEETNGLQAAGFGNIAEQSEGVQASGFINITGDIKGAQIAGFLNVAEKVKGVQIGGFLNVCDTIDGIPIAPISVVKKGGYRRFEFWGNETFFMNTSFKIGIRPFYTIFTLGFKPGASDYNTGIGFGIGTNIELDLNKSLDLEAHSYIINRYFWENWDYNHLNQLRISFNYQIAEHFSIFAGPTFNILISDITIDADEIAPSWAFNIADRKDSIRGWFGFNAGMRF